MKRTVTVSGQGSARVVPDSAVVRVAAAHRAAGVAEAFAGVTSATDAMAATARRFTDPAKIASTDFSVWPAYDNEGRPAGFEARHGLRVVVTDLVAAGGLLTALADAVGDRLQVESVSLEVADPSAALTEARTAAFADARARAEHLSTLSDAVLGEVVTVSEGGSSAQPLEAAPVALRAAAAKDVSFEPGERAITAYVTVTWRLVAAI